MDFYKSNSAADNICFLIKLDVVPENKTMSSSEIRVQASRDVIATDFHPPPKINSTIDEARGYSDYNLTLNFTQNPFVTMVETNIYAVSDGEGPKDARWVILSCCHDL